MLVCPNCGEELELSEVSEICTNCGVTIPAGMEEPELLEEEE